jgi:hypothetical protein
MDGMDVLSHWIPTFVAVAILAAAGFILRGSVRRSPKP